MMALLFNAFLVGLCFCVALNIRTIVSTATSHVHVINGLVATRLGSRQPAQLQKLARILKLCGSYTYSMLIFHRWRITKVPIRVR